MLIPQESQPRPVSAPSGAEGGTSRRGTFLLPFVCLLAIYCLWVFSLPVFPTQDGAIHLYYVNVIRHILSGTGDFSAFYLLRHPPPPYILHYALLYGLTTFLQPVLAEKFVVCLILTITGFAFRFLSNIIGRNGGLLSLWVVPLLLSWPLFMGFHNYCLALGISLWGWGYWLRARQAGDAGFRYKSIFLVLVVLILFTHPLPLLFLLAVIGVDLLAQGVSCFRLKVSFSQALLQLRGSLVTAAIAYSSLLYLALFVDRGTSQADFAQRVSRLHILETFVRLRWMTFATGGTAMQIHRLALCGVLLLALTLAIKDWRRRSGGHRLSDSFVALSCAVGLSILLPLLPPNMNGSEDFSNRLTMLVWICALAAASRTRQLGKISASLMAGAACTFALVTLALANHFIAPVANQIYEMESIAVQRGRIGLLFDSPGMSDEGRLTFNPFLRWQGGRYFRRSNAILLNDPWVSPPYPLPLRREKNSLTKSFSSKDFIDPGFLHEHLLNSFADREKVLQNVDFILFVGKQKQNGASPDSLISLDQSRAWKCQSKDWYSVCEPNAGRAFPLSRDPFQDPEFTQSVSRVSK